MLTYIKQHARQYVSMYGMSRREAVECATEEWIFFTSGSTASMEDV